MKLGLGPLSLAFVLSSSACSTGAEPAAGPPPPPAAPAPDVTPERGEVRVAFVEGEREVSRIHWGDAFRVRVTGLAPGEEITLGAVTRLADGDYASEARFVADEQGSVDTRSAAPVEGSWTEADEDALVWSMRPKKNGAPKDLPDWAIEVTASADGEVLSRARLDRWYIAEGTKREDVTTDGLVGVFYTPPGASKLPTVVIFGGSEGGLFAGEDGAAYWSSRGYAALGLAYFAEKGLPQYLAEIPLEYFDKAFAWLDTRPEADASRLAVMGASRGGELALLLGATFPRIKAVVAEVPSGVSWGAPRLDATEASSWTHAGTGLPFVPYSTAVPPDERSIAGGKTAFAYTPQFRDAIAKASPATLTAATFAVEKIEGPVLLLGGKEDDVWPSCELAKIAMDRLVASGHAAKHADESICYEGAGHAATLTPGLPTEPMTAAYHPLARQWLSMGGTPRGIARAQRDAHERIGKFLSTALH